jgi:hypothetical protein
MAGSEKSRQKSEKVATVKDFKRFSLIPIPKFGAKIRGQLQKLALKKGFWVNK